MPTEGRWEAAPCAVAAETLPAQGYTLCVEISPHPTRLEMAERCVPEAGGVWLPSLRRGRDDWQQMLESLGALYVHGVEVNWLGFDHDYPRRRLALPTYPFQRQRFWLGSNGVETSSHEEG